MVLIDTGMGNAAGCAPRLSVASWRKARPGDAEWDALSATASEPNPFFERWFLLPSLSAFDPHGGVQLAQLRIDGTLIGIAPLHHARSYYRRPVPNLEIWLHDNAFCGMPLIAPGFEAAFWSALLQWADANAGTAAFLHLPALPERSAPDLALAELIRERARRSGVVEREVRALLSSSMSPDAYFEASLPNKKRKELRRQARRLAEQGMVSVTRAETADAASAWAAEFLALENASWKGREGSALASDPARARFFRESVEGAATLRRFEGLSLLLDGRPIAMLATFHTPPGAFSFKTAYDESYARYSPGVLLQKENLQLLGREDIAWCDSCAAPDHPMIDHFWREQRALVSRNIAVGGRARRLLGGTLIAHESRRLDRSIAA